MKTANLTTMTPFLALKLVMVAALWGGTFIAGRILAQSLPLMTAAFGRFFVASILLVIVAVKMESKLPRLNRQQLLLTAVLGFTGIFLYNICFFGALARVPAGRTSLFVSLTPIVTAILAGLIFSERLGLRRWMGIVIALLGAIVVITRGDLLGGITDIGQSLGLGELMMLGAVLSWATYTLISRKALETLSPIAATTYGTLWGFVFLSIGAFGELKDIDWALLDWRVWTSVFYLGAFGTVLAFIWYYQGIQRVGPSRTAIFTNLVPAFGVLFSAALLGEPILISMVVGGLIAALGVSLVNKK
jgi:drug/metabolite transporter (DMT)-like permease